MKLICFSQCLGFHLSGLIASLALNCLAPTSGPTLLALSFLAHLLVKWHFVGFFSVGFADFPLFLFVLDLQISPQRAGEVDLCNWRYIRDIQKLDPRSICVPRNGPVVVYRIVDIPPGKRLPLEQPQWTLWPRGPRVSGRTGRTVSTASTGDDNDTM